jgi:hypothetical protein
LLHSLSSLCMIYSLSFRMFNSSCYNLC